MTAQRKLFLDEMLSGDIAAQLRAKGHDVTAVVEQSDLSGTPDEELLVHATLEDRLLVTANVRDFAAIHGTWSSRGRRHAGLIFIVNRVFPSDRSFVGAIVTALDDAIAAGQLPAEGSDAYLGRRRPEAGPRWSEPLSTERSATGRSSPDLTRRGHRKQVGT